MMRNAFRVVLMMAVVLGFVGVAWADDAAEAKKGVEAFVTAWQAGDAKAMQETLVMPAGKEKDLGTILDAVASISRLQKAAKEKFGDSATEYFADASGQFAARMKAIKEGEIKVKVAGESVVLTIAPDEAAKTRGGTLVLVKKGGVWKIDGGTLFDITPSLVAMSKQLTAVADGITKEIADKKYAAAVDAYQAFQARYTAALKETAATQPGK